MEPLEIKVKHPLRDPLGDAARYEEYCAIGFTYYPGQDGYKKIIAESFASWDTPQRINFFSGAGWKCPQFTLYMYARGDQITDLIRRIEADLPYIESHTKNYRSRWGERAPDQIDRQEGLIDCSDRKSFSYLALALILLPQASQVQTLASLLNTQPEYRFYLSEILLKAFVPDWTFAKKYKKLDKYQSPWAEPILRALAQPPERRSEALADYMKSWCRVMKPFGWKPVRDYSKEATERRGELESVFEHFAYEVALAVCAYDIDDSRFRDHPYYPRDLVDYYRANVRQTRDAWRGIGVGAGVRIDAPPPPKKMDLAKSKSKGLTRWVELASDGDIDATEAVIDQVGKLRKVKELSPLSDALAENDAGIHADIKDDDTLYSQLDSLAQKRQLGEFDAPEAAGGAAAGPARCEQLLKEGAVWLTKRGYRLVELDGNDDAWHAVVIQADYHAEFLTLSQELGLRTREPGGNYL